MALEGKLQRESIPSKKNPGFPLFRRRRICLWHDAGMTHQSMQLSEKHCVPCGGGTPPLKADEIARYAAELKTKWDVINEKKLRREFKFKDFKQAMAFVNKVAGVAESEGHHPDIFISYNRVVIELWTHAIKGLSENDFIVARKIELI